VATRTKYSERVKAKAVRLMNQGLSCDVIAKKIGLETCPTLIYKWKNKAIQEHAQQCPDIWRLSEIMCDNLGNSIGREALSALLEVIPAAMEVQ